MRPADGGDLARGRLPAGHALLLTCHPAAAGGAPRVVYSVRDTGHGAWVRPPGPPILGGDSHFDSPPDMGAVAWDGLAPLRIGERGAHRGKGDNREDDEPGDRGRD